MFAGHSVIDADSHKCANPVVFFDYLPEDARPRIDLIRDRFGEQRFRIRDRHRGNDLTRVFLQPEGYGKGTYRPYHDETTMGGLFNRVRMLHMDREGIDHQVVYGSITLAFNSLADAGLATALCRAYNDYIRDDCAAYEGRLHPVAVLPLQDPAAAVEEMRRAVLELGFHAVTVAPNVPAPHPAAPERFPEIRVPKHLSHPDFDPIWREAERLGIAIGVHGAPGVQLAGGTSDQLDSFTLVHVFANRSMQQMALARLIFDGTLERFPALRFGFLEAGVGWLPDLMQSLHEHWEKRIVHFDPSVQPGVGEFVLELARERRGASGPALVRQARRLMTQILVDGPRDKATPGELEAFRNEHPQLRRDPFEYLARGQVFLTFEPDDPAPAWLPSALGEIGRRVCGMAIDYGHWDATLRDCVALVSGQRGVDPAHAVRLLSANALEFYGDRLRSRIHRCGAGEAVQTDGFVAEAHA
jgi:predicted TIM-barrel fold metal-dependent hydrolase